MLRKALSIVSGVVIGACALNALATPNLFHSNPWTLTSCPVVSTADESTANFCRDFKKAVQCQCTPLMGPEFCASADRVYKMMMATYGGSLSNACNDQHAQHPDWVPDVNLCIEQWTCYEQGGKTSIPDGKGGFLNCSSTGDRCPTDNS